MIQTALVVAVTFAGILLVARFYWQLAEASYGAAQHDYLTDWNELKSIRGNLNLLKQFAGGFMATFIAKKMLDPRSSMTYSLAHCPRVSFVSYSMLLLVFAIFGVYGLAINAGFDTWASIQQTGEASESGTYRLYVFVPVTMCLILYAAGRPGIRAWHGVLVAGFAAAIYLLLANTLLIAFRWGGLGQDVISWMTAPVMYLLELRGALNDWPWSAPSPIENWTVGHWIAPLMSTIGAVFFASLCGFAVLGWLEAGSTREGGIGRIVLSAATLQLMPATLLAAYQNAAYDPAFGTDEAKAALGLGGMAAVFLVVHLQSASGFYRWSFSATAASEKVDTHSLSS